MKYNGHLYITNLLKTINENNSEYIKFIKSRFMEQQCIYNIKIIYSIPINLKNFKKA